MLLKDRTAIVTGAAAGIGLAITERLAKEGAAVLMADRDAARGEANAQRLRAAGATVTFIEADVSDLDSIDALVAEAVTQFGKIDVLVNNAGVTKRVDILDITPKDWDWIQSINTRGMFFCLQRVAAHMKEKGGGRIVNIASVSGKGMRGASNASYAASKAAAIVVARVAAAELGKFNITVNSVCPGVTRTELVDRLEAENPEAQARLYASTALGRINEPADIADAVAFLSSDMARNITGQSLNVDCGMLWD